MASKVVNITIKLKDGVSTGLGKIKKSLASSVAAMKRFAIAGVAMAAAVGVAVAKMTKIFMVQQDAENALASALTNAGYAGEKVLPIFKAFASELQRVTKYGDELILSTMAYGQNLGIQASQLRDATKAAAGLAAKYGIDLKTAMMLVGRASQGQTTMLTRYGITLDESLSSQEKFNELLKIGAKAFGLAEADANTLSGSIEQLKNALGDAQEELIAAMLEGGNLTEGIQNLTTAILDMIEQGDIAFWAKEARDAFDAVHKAMKPVITAMGWIKKQKNALSEKMGGIKIPSIYNPMGQVKLGLEILGIKKREEELESSREMFHEKHKARKAEEKRLAEEELSGQVAINKATQGVDPATGAAAGASTGITSSFGKKSNTSDSYQNRGTIMGTFGGSLIGARREWADPVADLMPDEGSGAGGSDSSGVVEVIQKTNRLLVEQNELLDDRLGGVKDGE